VTGGCAEGKVLCDAHQLDTGAAPTPPTGSLPAGSGRWGQLHALAAEGQIGSSLVYCMGQLVLVGGQDSDGALSNEFWEYDKGSGAPMLWALVS
jgi:hypothetical protein